MRSAPRSKRSQALKARPLRAGAACRPMRVSGVPAPSLQTFSIAPLSCCSNCKWIADFTYVWTAEGWRYWPPSSTCSPGAWWVGR